MPSKNLDAGRIKTLQPAEGLFGLLDPSRAPHRFRARTRTQAIGWQKKTRRELARMLNSLRLPAAPFDARTIERVDKGDYVREKTVIRTSAYTSMPVYFLIPKDIKRPAPVILAFHGHGYGVKDIVGLWEDGSERDTPDGYHADFAVALCRRGFVVAAPEISCFGERRSIFKLPPGSPVPGTCHHASTLAFHLGGSVAGLRVHDARRLVDYLKERPEVNTARLGAMGISGGGYQTFYSSCVDTRIKAAVISGYYSTYRDSILDMDHCDCNYIPGLHVFGEMYDLVGLIAPRPVLIEAGQQDPIFPIAAVKKSVRRARDVYRVFGSSDGIRTDYFEGRHRINGDAAYAFLVDQLGG